MLKSKILLLGTKGSSKSPSSSFMYLFKTEIAPRFYMAFLPEKVFVSQTLLFLVFTSVTHLYFITFLLCFQNQLQLHV